MANIIYMATNGNDSTGDGTYSNPYLTFATAYAATSYGDTLILKNGTYNIGNQFNDDNQLRQGDKITIKAEVDNMVVIQNHNTSSLTTDTSKGLFHKRDNSHALESAKTGADNIITVTFQGIIFYRIYMPINTALFTCAGEDQYEFIRCTFKDITVGSQEKSGLGGFIGLPAGTTTNTLIEAFQMTNDTFGFNGRGIFKYCIFKDVRCTLTGSKSQIGIFNCMGYYLRFINCSFDFTDITHPWNHVFYASHPRIVGSGSVVSLWNNALAESNMTTFNTTADDYFPVNDIKCINCVFYCPGTRTTKGSTVPADPVMMFSYSTDVNDDSEITPQGDVIWYNSSFENCVFYHFSAWHHGNDWRYDTKYMFWPLDSAEATTNCTACTGAMAQPDNWTLFQSQMPSRIQSLIDDGKSVDPGFVDPNNGNYNIRPSSILIGSARVPYNAFLNVDIPDYMTTKRTRIYD